MCMVHWTVHRLSCYMNIQKYSKLFIQIVRETSFRETSVRESDCLGNVRYPSMVLMNIHKHEGVINNTHRKVDILTYVIIMCVHIIVHNCRIQHCTKQF